jgi:hypothetical protein
MRRVLVCVLVIVLGAAAPAAGAQRKVPRGWLGVMADGPLFDAPAALDGEWDGMAAAGVETVRLTFLWRSAQPYRTFAEVPPDQAVLYRDVGGVPTNFTVSDALVAAAARRHLQILPNVLQTPDWAAQTPGDPASPPRDRAAYGRYLAALIARYGPRGSLWSERPVLPRVPIRAWQIWNEPSLPLYWSRQPFARSYVALLKASRVAVHTADHGATVVTAGLPNQSWVALRSIYRAGGRGTFDAVALHPYTSKPSNVVRLVEFSRHVMSAFHDDRTPVWVTELSWPAALGKVSETHGFETTNAGQAVKLVQTLRRLVRERRRLRIEKAIWYTWLSVEGGQNSFAWSGLRRMRDGALVNAPALAAFRGVARRVEGCAKAPGDASRCR